MREARCLTFRPPCPPIPQPHEDCPITPHLGLVGRSPSCPGLRPGITRASPCGKSRAIFPNSAPMPPGGHVRFLTRKSLKRRLPEMNRVKFERRRNRPSLAEAQRQKKRPAGPLFFNPLAKTSARVELDHLVRLHVGGIRHLRQPGHARHFRRPVAVIDLDVIRRVALGEAGGL